MSFTRHPTLTFDFCVYFIFILLQINQPSIDNFQERRDFGKICKFQKHTTNIKC